METMTERLARYGIKQKTPEQIAEEAAIQISTKAYSKDSTGLDLEPVEPICVTFDKTVGVDRGGTRYEREQSTRNATESLEASGLEETVSSLNAALRESAREHGITHLFEVRYLPHNNIRSQPWSLCGSYLYATYRAWAMGYRKRKA